ncbi:hypothetical protein PtA15_17A46 [Puccinia triticina]|uniref:Uncharacterized protein n=1 Tax=Puccinia triticina TaxID=208348 RepID=A0ABY7D6T0_9BASI|nr:uncharacterized protein PtA15_17A46 [Puccinia triticina]WAQ92565.1 hypothetical protein PtA15_17A46 [Puccinia triticina]
MSLATTRAQGGYAAALKAPTRHPFQPRTTPPPPGTPHAPATAPGIHNISSSPRRPPARPREPSNAAFGPSQSRARGPPNDTPQRENDVPPRHKTGRYKTDEHLQHARKQIAGQHANNPQTIGEPSRSHQIPDIVASAPPPKPPPD